MSSIMDDALFRSLHASYHNGYKAGRASILMERRKTVKASTPVQQLKAEIAALESRLRFIGCVDVNDTEELRSIREKMRQLSAV